MEINYTFSKKEKLCFKKQIDQLFENGRWLRSEHLRMVYLLSDHTVEKVFAQIMFTVPKKHHRKAVKRNLLKRRLREAYRLTKPGFYSRIQTLDSILLLGVVYSNNEEADFKTLQSELKHLLAQAASRILSHSKSY